MASASLARRRRRAERYLWAVTGLGVLTLAVRAPVLVPQHWWVTGITLLMVAGGSLWPIPLRRGYVDFTGAGVLLAYLLGGPASALWAQLGGSALGLLYRRRPRLQAAANLGILATALSAATMAAGLVRGTALRALTLILVDLVLNHVLVCGYFAVGEGPLEAVDAWRALRWDLTGWMVGLPAATAGILLSYPYPVLGEALTGLIFVTAVWFLALWVGVRRLQRQALVVAGSLGQVTQVLDGEALEGVEAPISRTLDFSAWAFYLGHEPGRPLELRAARGAWDVGLLPPPRLEPGDGLAGWALATGQPLRIPDLDQEAGGLFGPVREPGLAGFRAALLVPMVSGRTVTGLAVLLHHDAGRYRATDLELSRIVGMQVGTTVKTRHLLHETRRLSVSDPLIPQLFNYRYFVGRLEEAVARAARGEGTGFSVLFLDLDGFKCVNDRYGHLKGDAVLREAVEVLRGEIRQEDVLARYAGDEFVALLPGAGAEEAARVRDRIGRRIAAHGFSGVREVLSISVGIATYGIDGADVDTLLNVADQRMYREKRRHKEAASDREGCSGEGEKRRADVSHLTLDTGNAMLSRSSTGWEMAEKGDMA